MESLVGVVTAGSILLIIAGAHKVVDPWPAANALAQAGRRVDRRAVQVGAAAETALGAAFVVFGGRPLAVAVAVVYGAFAVFVAHALRVGVDGSCGCFGREDTPPSWLHVVVNVGVATAAVLYASGSVPSPVDELAPTSPTAAALAAATVVLVGALAAVYTVLPRTLAAVRAPLVP